MDQALLYHRFHFAFTASYHYLFPQLTMGLGLLIVLLQGIGLRTGDERWDRAALFWARIFGLSFLMGVVTGIPMEFQFGTNWARFSDTTGGVIGQTLAMEGVFAFFLESSFLALFLFGRDRLGPACALRGRRRRVAGIVDLRLLHRRHERVDAAPRRPHRRTPTDAWPSRASVPSSAIRGSSGSMRIRWSAPW